MDKKSLLILLFVGFMFQQSQLIAQVNIKIGYNIGFPQLPVSDQLLSAYQPEGEELVQSFGGTGFMHGIQLGVRYRWENVAVELGWENMSRDRTALSYEANSDLFTDRQYNYSISGLTIGLDNYFGNLGIGSSLHYQKLGINRVVGNNNLNIAAERNLALRLSLLWQVQKSEFVSFYIKPYYQFSFDGYDLTALANDLSVTVADLMRESPEVFGIALVFYNGRQ